MKKLLYGICGIGLGHTYRQLPLLEKLVETHKIAIFAYGESLSFCQKKFASYQNVSVISVGVPFLTDGRDGINFEASLCHPANTVDFMSTNMRAFAAAKTFIGKPDFVITDYEPTSAQYAYMLDAPLYTYDQQSKYLVGDFPEHIGGQSMKAEVERLRLFFPKAHKRIVTSFFDIPLRKAYQESVHLVRPALRAELTDTLRMPQPNLYLVYLSAQDGFTQPLSEIVDICRSQPDKTFHIYAKGGTRQKVDNTHIYPHGAPTFTQHLLTCEGLICTAGHSLLSEATALGVPVYAMPLPVYEQHVNALAILENKWGVSYPTLDTTQLAAFIRLAKEFSHSPQPYKNSTATLLDMILGQQGSRA